MDAASCAVPAVGRSGGGAVCPKAGVAAANAAHKRKPRGRTIMILSGFVVRPSAMRMGLFGYSTTKAAAAPE